MVSRAFLGVRLMALLQLLLESVSATGRLFLWTAPLDVCDTVTADRPGVNPVEDFAKKKN